MGKRKFTLSQRKNYERKKYPVNISPSVTLDCEPTLIVSIPITVYINKTVETSEDLFGKFQSLCGAIPSGWSIEGDGLVRGNFDIVKVFKYGTMKITIYSDCSWAIFVNEMKILLPDHTLLQFTEKFLNSCYKVITLVNTAEQCELCAGNPDDKFFELKNRRKGGFLGQDGKILAYYDENSLPSPSIRSSNCSMFIHNVSSSPRCGSCNGYRKTLFALLSKSKKSSIVVGSHSFSSRTNYRYMSSPEKTARLRDLTKMNRMLRDEVHRLKLRLDSALEWNNSTLNEDISEDLHQVLNDEENNISKTFPPDSFPSIFWKHQREALSKKGREKNGVRWHPLMIKWCLYLRHQSGKMYEALRDSGCIVLPSQRTLRDYSNAVVCDAGFSFSTDQQLLQAAKLETSPAYHSLVLILMDEMYIREELVYNKHTGKLVGFTNLGDINNHLSQFESSLSEDDTATHQPTLAKSMLAFMVRGIFTSLKFPYAMFPCSSLAGEQLFSAFWECVFRLERIGFKVLGTTFDGASTNRRLVAIHNSKEKIVYKIRNMYADEERYIYCFSDPPHLIKTVRNCWATKNRSLWNNGRYILWQHLIDFYDKDNGKASGLSMVMKLKYEHIHLTPFSKMRVDLAAQVLSESVGKAIELTGGPATEETSKFILMFDKFFDILNVSNFTNWKRHRKPFQKPYSNSQDERLKWLEEVFLPYLDSWEKSVFERHDFSDAQKKRMTLSNETLVGIRRTVLSFVEFVKYIFALTEVQEHNLEFLSNHICQDPLESFFGCQRQRGGTSDNPSVSEFYQNTQALRVIDSFCRDPIRGNCRIMSKRRNDIQPSDFTPLAKRRKPSMTLSNIK